MQRSACSQRSPCSDWKQAHAHDREHAEHRETVGTGLPGSYYFLLILTLLNEAVGWLLSDSHHTSPFLVVMRSSCWPSALSTLQRIENCSLYIFHLSCWRNGSLRIIFTQQPKSRFASPGSSWSSWYQGHLRPSDLHSKQSMVILEYSYTGIWLSLQLRARLIFCSASACFSLSQKKVIISWFQ